MPPNSTFYSLVPKGWLRDYLDVMLEAKNEMPLPFHFLAGAALIGNTMGLNTWATLAKGVRVFPNINALLLSPAGKCRRGEGTKITTAIGRQAGINIFSGKITPEGLADELVDNGNLVLYVEELSMLLTKQDFQVPLISLLTKLLLHGDGPSEFRTRALGKRVQIPFVNLTALFTSAPDWFMTTIPREAYGGGLMSRFIVCCLDDREVYHIDIQSDDINGNALAKLASELDRLRSCGSGYVRGTDDAQKWIEGWYDVNEKAPVDDDRVLPHRNRKPANLLRMALILARSQAELSLTKAHLENSLAILDWMEPTLIKLYGMTEEVANVMMGGERRILAKLRVAPEGTLTHTLLSRSCASYFRGGTQEMRRCLDGLIEKGLVEPVYKSGIRCWPPKDWKLVG